MPVPGEHYTSTLVPWLYLALEARGIQGDNSLSHPSLSPRASLICLYSSCVLPLHGRLQKEESRADLWGDLGAEERASAGSAGTVEGQVHG